MVADALANVDERSAADIKAYQSLVGALLYASTNTRPDIAFAVGYLCRAMAKPTPELHDAALRVLEYLYRTRDIGLRYAHRPGPVDGYSDSDWATRHSTSGHVFTWNQAAISWGSRKQGSIALSSCEAEIMAASEAAKEAVYLNSFLKELGYASDGPATLKVDNQGAIDLAYNPEFHQKTKHIERRHFYVRELVEQMRLTVPYVATVDNLADFFTKPLSAKVFYPMRDAIMNVPHALRGVPSAQASGHGGVLKEARATATSVKPRGG